MSSIGQWHLPLQFKTRPNPTPTPHFVNNDYYIYKLRMLYWQDLQQKDFHLSHRNANLNMTKIMATILRQEFSKEFLNP